VANFLALCALLQCPISTPCFNALFQRWLQGGAHLCEILGGQFAALAT